MNFGYRIINKLVAPVTSDVEIKTIEEAVKDAESNVRLHLNSALEKIVRQTNRRLSQLHKGINLSSGGLLPQQDRKEYSWAGLGSNGGFRFEAAFFIEVSLLAGSTAILTRLRQASAIHFMESDGSFVPTADEVIYMLITSSAFINYLRKRT